MKFLAAILSIYLLTLNFTYCEDVDVADSDAKIEFIQETSTSHGHSDLDFCSPFCQCQCCQAFIAFYDMAKLETVPTYLSTDLIYYFDRIEDDLNFPILRPPKI